MQVSGPTSTRLSRFPQRDQHSSHRDFAIVTSGVVQLVSKNNDKIRRMTEPPMGDYTMLAGPDAYRLIKHFESLRLISYPDPKGILTIGWGHTGDDVHPHMIIGKEEAERLLCEDVHFVENQLMRMIVRHPIAQHQFDALVSWAFNIGVERAKKSTLIKFFNFGEDDKAATEFLRWSVVKIHGKRTQFRGLMNRRSAERELFLTGHLTIGI
jgi:lysozyme